jgi:hypothetical protein
VVIGEREMNIGQGGRIVNLSSVRVVSHFHDLVQNSKRLTSHSSGLQEPHRSDVPV